VLVDQKEASARHLFTATRTRGGPAFMTVRLIPKALDLKSPDEILALNKVLQECTVELEKAIEHSAMPWKTGVTAPRLQVKHGREG
jgi:hypothetical protein